MHSRYYRRRQENHQHKDRWRYWVEVSEDWWSALYLVQRWQGVDWALRLANQRRCAQDYKPKANRRRPLQLPGNQWLWTTGLEKHKLICLWLVGKLNISFGWSLESFNLVLGNLAAIIHLFGKYWVIHWLDIPLR